MFTFVILALMFSVPESSAPHVRATDPKILTLIDAGISDSATFESLIAMLIESDVIVYIEPKLIRHVLSGYLPHNVVAQRQSRYLRIAVEIAGSERRLASLLAHELQHAVEVARAPEARDSDSIEPLFRRLAVKSGCVGTNCFETKVARDVEHFVEKEFGNEPHHGHTCVTMPPRGTGDAQKRPVHQRHERFDRSFVSHPEFPHSLTSAHAGQFSASRIDEPLPEPVAEAIRLLGWSADDVPRIAVVDTKPPHLADNVEAWVVFEKELARPLIYMRSDIDVYREAGRGDYQARVRLAGILAHERWHLRYGRDEVGAYAAQLAIMEYLHANSLSLAAVRMAFQRVVREAQRGAGTSK
jgi:hypothetical protein